MYQVQIIIKAKDGNVLVSKDIKMKELEGLLIINGSDLYTEAQQKEIVEGLDLIDEEDIYNDFQ